MPPTPLFTGRVLDGGLLIYDRPKDYAKYLRTLGGQYIETVTRRRRAQRSIDQNAYLHAVPFFMIADYTGDDIESVKLNVMGACWGWRKSSITGIETPLKPHTSHMTTEEGSYLIEWLPPWAFQQFNGMVIPLPNEASW